MRRRSAARPAAGLRASGGVGELVVAGVGSGDGPLSGFDEDVVATAEEDEVVEVAIVAPMEDQSLARRISAGLDLVPDLRVG